MRRAAALSTAMMLLALSPVSAHAAPQRPADDFAHHNQPLLTGALNFRDLGGYMTVDGRYVRRGMLFRSDALNALSEQDLSTLRKLNIVRVVDLRTSDEVIKSPDLLPQGSRIDRISLPVALTAPRPHEGDIHKGILDGPGEMRWLDAINHALATDVYPGFVSRDTEQYRIWLHGLLDTPDGAQIVHCSGGADRTGFAAAIFLLTLGVPRSVIIKDYLLTNSLLFSPKGRALLDARTPLRLPRGLKMRSRFIKAAFTEMKRRYGSIDAYLRIGLGVDASFREQLRSRYLDPNRTSRMPVLERSSS